MKDITDKIETLRTAVAEAFLKIDAAILESVDQGRRTDKGDALEVARVAGVMAAKRTWENIPFCHPVPITYANVAYSFEADGIALRATVKTMASTGVEMEALSAASMCALTLYDMLKPHAPADTGVIEIQSIRLVAKSGGKSDFRLQAGDRPLRAAVLMVSDAVVAGDKDDAAAQVVLERLKRYAHIELVDYEILSNDTDLLRQSVDGLLARGLDLLVTVGGTGLGERDLTVETLERVLDRQIPGIMEFARAHGQRRTPRAMLSRGIAGSVEGTLVLALPGSTRGARESCDALFPGVLHYFEQC
ncbi:MAG: bifunctional molybdenum cofactor biosynthesis protein MoaC/MoaB [Bradymonadaceae bacterium]|nr:bifunctional molybdenum cofactor biosynthesis protein MoaC/MoaB [Lujinxingiaceae bacterium]